jgi:carbon-monoxide dehydrogenase medium subunit
MRDFEYEAPHSLSEAIALLSRSNGRARPLAGGTDLIDHLRTGRLAPDLIVDLKKIPELGRFEYTSNELRIGAAVPCYRIYEHGRVLREYAALADSCRIIGGVQIQNRASVGGNLCNSGPAADSIPSLIALSAVCVIAGPDGTREVPAEDFCTGPGTNILKPGEILVEFRFPRPRCQWGGSHYRRFIPRNEMDIAVVGVAADVQLDGSRRKIAAARIALGAVAPKPLFAADASQSLVGKPADETSIAEAARAARALAKPIDDMRGTVEFRLHVTEVLVRRVLTEAIARAGGPAVSHDDHNGRRGTDGA